MYLIVLCGGLGTRLGHLTRETPKPMLHVAGKPFLCHLLDQFQHMDMEGIVMAVGFQWEKISSYFGNQWNGVPIHYAVESTPLGTGGAVKYAMSLVAAQEALIVNGDTLFVIDTLKFLQFAKSNDASTSIALRQVADCSRYGRVTLSGDGRILSFGEKDFAGPGLINAGIYYQRASAFADIAEESFSFETDYLTPLNRLQAIYGLAMHGYFIDIGITSDFDRAQTELLRLPPL
jgi:D-glycero-alpha-D-manno-heptose 1-phosphate guanylyltransferase